MYIYKLVSLYRSTFCLWLFFCLCLHLCLSLCLCLCLYFCLFLSIYLSTNLNTIHQNKEIQFFVHGNISYINSILLSIYFRFSYLILVVKLITFLLISTGLLVPKGCRPNTASQRGFCPPCLINTFANAHPHSYRYINTYKHTLTHTYNHVIFKLQFIKSLLANAIMSEVFLLVFFFFLYFPFFFF